MERSCTTSEADCRGWIKLIDTVKLGSRIIISDYDSHMHNVEHEAESSILVSKLPTLQRTSYLGHQGPLSSTNKRVTITNSSRPLWPLGSSSAMSRLTLPELEKQLRKMKASQVLSVCLDLASQLKVMERQLLDEQQQQQQQRPRNSNRDLERINEEEENEELKLASFSESNSDSALAALGRTRCRFSVTGCPFRLPSMEQHEERECRYRPTRCPSLTCPVKPPFVKLLKHIEVCMYCMSTYKS